MMRPIILIIAAVAVGAASFMLCYRLSRADGVAGLAGTSSELEWLRTEFDLTPAQTERVAARHEEYLPQCQEHCARYRDGRQRLDEMLRRQPGWSLEVDSVVKELSAIRSECHQSLLRYASDVAACMPPEQGRRYLAMIREQVLRGDPTGMLAGTR